MNNVDSIAYALDTLKGSLCKDIDVGGLFSRNKVAHKWKAPWRALMLREAVAWRTQDLLEQSHMLHSHKALLGARILLRSAFETIAVLIYLNQSMRAVVAGKADFHEFSKKTTQLLLGSRDKSTTITSINIVTILGKADARYPGLVDLYAVLSESAHPNHEGLVLGYSTNDRKNYTTHFENKWSEMYSKTHDDTLVLCLGTFEHEYNDEFISAIEELETWMEANDAMLEATKQKEPEE